MSHRSRQLDVRLPLAVILALCLSNGGTAATYFWDTNGATAGIGSATTPASWLTNSWATTSTGVSATSAWPNTQPVNVDEAVFQGTAGVVTLPTDVHANALRFQTNNYTICSTGGTLRLSGSDPRITVNLASNNQVVTVAAPVAAASGFTIAGNSLSGGLKFLVLANTSAVTPNSFGGTLTIAPGGALRLGGGATREQIPDDVDLVVDGVIDFITSGGASDMKQEKVRNVAVSGAGAIFSVGNGSDFVVNSLTGTSAQNISVNGNAATVPGKLSISGWSDGGGALTLNSSYVKLNTTSATNAIGGRIVLSGDIVSNGDSRVINNNGNAASVNANVFTHKHFDFAAAAHTVHVADGTLLFTSASTVHPLEITTTQVGGAVVTKTGAGIWQLENAVQTNFVGATRVVEGTLRLDCPALADGADLQLLSGALVDLNFAGADVIDSLFIDGVSQAAGTWGSLDSAATYKSPLFVGMGLLQVNTFVPPPSLPGDYNADQVVDAADYTLWRDLLGSSATLPNDETPGSVTDADYQVWLLNFGHANGSSGAAGGAAVPESDGFMLILLAVGTHAGTTAHRRG